MKVVETMAGAAAAVLLMAGCAFTPIKPGMSREEVVASHGAPTAIVPLSAGSRLQYSRHPAGQSVVAVDLDAAGEVVSVREMMALNELNRIEPGRWTRQDVLREFGRPASIDHVASWKGDIMTYRWRDNAMQDMFFWAYLDAQDRVQRTGQGMDIPSRIEFGR